MTHIQLKTAIISGAAGGLGRATVKLFKDNGFRIIALDVDATRMTDLYTDESVHAYQLDVTKSGEIRKFVDDSGIVYDGLDVLVCLAGVYDTFPLTEADPGKFKRMMDINLHGTAALVQGLLNPLVIRQGRVIVVSSESYKMQAMFQPYMVSKAALEAYCQSARQELALKGISLSVIRPGAIRTPLLAWMKSKEFTAQYPVFKKDLEASWQKSLTMVGRISDPVEVAGVVLRAAISSRPKRIYRINNNPLLKLAALIPRRILDRMMIRMIKNSSGVAE